MSTLAGARPALTEREAARIVEVVLEGEGVVRAAVSLTFLTGPRMRGLNRRAFGRDHATDVIAFTLSHRGDPVGDIYICSSIARRSAKEEGISAREEEMRLVVHGTLHILGHDHPDGPRRNRSPMWRLQERYVRRVSPESSA